MGNRTSRARKRREEQPQIAFANNVQTDEPQVVVRVNFGVFTGREATAAEIDRLAERLLDRVDHVTIVSETHHEIDTHSEAAVHQVRIEITGAAGGDTREALEQWLVERAELWARACIAERTSGAA